MRGLHAGLIVFAGVGAANIGNYAFHLLAAHLLGPDSYGGVVSLLTLSGLVSLPLAGVQIAVARAVATHEARGNRAATGRLLTRGVLLALGVGAAIAALMSALTPVIERALGVGSATAIVLTALVTVPALAMPVVWGVAQGLQRYGLLALSMVIGTALKAMLFLGFYLLGARLAGAILATLVAGALALAVTLWPFRHLARPAEGMLVALGSNLRELWPATTGLLAITSLTSIDVVVAKIALSSHDAGVYAGASLFGRVVLYLPAAIGTVLLPKVSARAHADRDATDIVGASLAVTALVCVAMTLVYVALPDAITRLLGDDFREAAQLLGPFALAMTLFALLNVLLIYDLGLKSTRMTALLALGAAAQVLGFVAFHDSAVELLAVSITVGAILLLLHEFLILRSSQFMLAWLGAMFRLATGKLRR